MRRENWLYFIVPFKFRAYGVLNVGSSGAVCGERLRPNSLVCGPANA